MKDLKTNFAVLCEHAGKYRVVNFGLFYEWDEQPDAIDIFHLMIKHDLEQIWVAPGHFNIEYDLRDRLIGRYGQADEDWKNWELKAYGDEGDYISSVHGYRKVGRYGSPERKMRSIIWPQVTAWSWGSDRADPFTLLLAIAQMQESYGVALSSSPGVTALNMLKKHLEARKHSAWLDPQSEIAQRTVPWDAAGKDCIWKKRFSQAHTQQDLRVMLEAAGEFDPAGKIYLHAVDKNSSYLSAASGLSIGIGEMRRFSLVETPEAAPKPDSTIPPGLWHVSAEAPLFSPFDGMEGPSPLYVNMEDQWQEWVSSPLLKLLWDLGFKVEVYEGYYWPQSRRIFETFAGELWGIRQGFRRLADIHTADGEPLKHYLLGLDSTKRAGNALFGLFGSEKARRPADRRRDIWVQVVEFAKARMFYNMLKVEKEMGLLPIAVYTDCLVYASQESNAAHALGLLDREEKLGGYKLKWTLEVDYKVLNALRVAEPSEMLHLLNCEAEQREQLLRWRKAV